MLKALGYCLVFSFVINSARSYSPPKYSACNKKDFGHGSFVCVCGDQGNECDQFERQGSSPLKPGQFAVYTSSKDGKRFDLKFGMFNKTASSRLDNVLNLTLDASTSYQSILGFGGAFTGKDFLMKIIIAIFRHFSFAIIHS